MPQIKLSRRAQNDLPRLYNFLAQWDTSIAQNAIDKIILALTALQMPEIGAPVIDSNGLRKLSIDFGDSGYSALYKYSRKTDTAVVLAIKHQKEDAYG